MRPAAVMDDGVQVQADGAALHGTLTVPDGARALVVFAHGSGSSRHSPRNRAVARTLQEKGLATLLFDLLTEAEEAGERAGGMQRFDIPFLAGRLDQVTKWAAADGRTKALPVAYFGSSTGAGAALVAAAERPEVVGVVSRGGRPDLAGGALAHVTCPVLLIVGGADPTVLDLNRDARSHMRTEVEMHIVPGATHLFEEPGALDEVAETAARWLTGKVGGQATPAGSRGRSPGRRPIRHGEDAPGQEHSSPAAWPGR